MKIRLLENIRMAGVSGGRGEIVDVDESLAGSLEQHGQASFLDESEGLVKLTGTNEFPENRIEHGDSGDSGAADDGGADADEVLENEAKPGERKSRRKGKAKE